MIEYKSHDIFSKEMGFTQPPIYISSASSSFVSSRLPRTEVSAEQPTISQILIQINAFVQNRGRKRASPVEKYISREFTTLPSHPPGASKPRNSALVSSQRQT
jgi:hypothetical protein